MYESERRDYLLILEYKLLVRVLPPLCDSVIDPVRKSYQATCCILLLEAEPALTIEEPEQQLGNTGIFIRAVVTVYR